MRLFRVAFPLLFGAFLAPALTFSAPSQSANAAGGQSASDAPKPAADPAVQTAAKKPKKVWTNDEISTAGGPGSISVVGNTDPDSKSSKGSSDKTAPVERSRERQIANYRDRLHQLRNELESTEKKISDLRNFKADNTSAAGGINMNRRYSMTPLEDQVKQLEERKKQLQSQIDAVEDQARKSGVEPGDLR